MCLKSTKLLGKLNPDSNSGFISLSTVIEDITLLLGFVTSDLSSDTVKHKNKYLEDSIGVCILFSVFSICIAMPVLQAIGM